MTDDIKKLIEEARDYAGVDEYAGATLLREIADALEAEHETAEERFRILVTVTNNAMRFSAERDALRTAIQRALHIAKTGADTHALTIALMKGILSRAIDTKEKP